MNVHLQNFWLALALGLAAAAADLAGGLLIVRLQWSRKYLKYFIAVGAGFMLAVAVLEMIPESMKLHAGATPDYLPNATAMVSVDVIGRVAIWVLAGYLLVHFFEHTLAPHFHFGEETHVEELTATHVSHAAVFGLAIHTFFDGVAIASGFIVSSWLGTIIFIAIFLHKFPEGFTVASLVMASGQGKRAAFYSSAFLGGATLLGVGLMYVWGEHVDVALPLAAGVTLYVAASDLIPEVNHEPHARMALLVFFGVAVMLGLKLAFHL